MKYIMFSIDHNGLWAQRVPIIFPNFLEHNQVASTIKPQIEALANGRPTTIVSAGFYNPNMRQCYGDSVSLQVESLEGDTMIIQEMDEKQGVIDQ